MPESTDNPYRALPPVNDLVGCEVLRDWRLRVPRSLVVRAAGAVLEDVRDRIRSGQAAPAPDALARCVADRLDTWTRSPLASAINGTGIMLHTGLGRAPLGDAAIDALLAAAGNYAPVELDLVTGDRGHRSAVVRPILAELTGAESAVVVNNNAAALTLVLAAVARGRSVLVSRGELIEIGGSFRLPDIIEAGGARLLEVGTTNRTRLDDYGNAIEAHGDEIAAILKVHTSNYRIEGFTESVSVEELAPLARRHGLALVDDIGSGALADVIPGEPSARAAVAAGADLVLFSGDKLLGGPQAGIIVGRRAHVERVSRHPLMRALRVDKLVLAALGATLQIHRDPERVRLELPVHRMLACGADELERRAERIVMRLGENGIPAEAHPSRAYLGGGSVPGRAVPSVAVVVVPVAQSEHRLARRLRAASPPVVARVSNGAVWADLRTVFPAQDRLLTDAIIGAHAPG